MPAGLSIRGASGALQIDQDFTALVLRHRGQCVLTPYPYPTMTPMVIYELVVPATTPILAIKPQFGYSVAVFKGYDMGNGNWRFFLRATGTENILVDYYVFDSAASFSPTENFGLEVFRDDGSRAYHSSMKLMRVTDLMEAGMPPADYNYDHSSYFNRGLYTPGRTYATVVASRGSFTKLTYTEMGMEPELGYRYFDYTATETMVTQYQNHEIEVGLQQYEYGQQQYPFSQNQYATSTGKQSALILDVTGY